MGSIEVEQAIRQRVDGRLETQALTLTDANITVWRDVSNAAQRNVTVVALVNRKPGVTSTGNFWGLNAEAETILNWIRDIVRAEQAKDDEHAYREPTVVLDKNSAIHRPVREDENQPRLAVEEAWFMDAEGKWHTTNLDSDTSAKVAS